MKIYISAPITGLPNDNRENFARIEKQLKLLGHEVINPSELGTENEWLDYIIRDLKLLRTCDAIYLGVGWRESFGCRIEYLVAQKLCIPIFNRKGWT